MQGNGPAKSTASSVSAISDSIQAKLAASSYADVRRVRCEYDKGILTLRGTLSSYYAVQVAISLVKANLDGDILIRNSVNVVSNLP